MSVAVRAYNTQSYYSPQAKRLVARHSNGKTLMLAPDTNSATGDGDDETGVAKLVVYMSTDANRTAYTQVINHTPTQAFATNTKYAVLCMAISPADDDLFIVYQGTDNSLRMVSFNWNGTGYDAGSTQTVLAANAVSFRIRAVDIDCTSGGTAANPAIIIMEWTNSNPSTYVRVYIRLNDGTTWRKAYEVTLHTTATPQTEDVSICWGADGVVTDVGRLALFWTGSSYTSDAGDTLREISFNVSTGTDNSATVVGSWKTNLNQGVAASHRKGWLYKNETIAGAACWVFAGVVGKSTPFYMGVKLHHNDFVSFYTNRTFNQPAESGIRKYAISVVAPIQCPVSTAFANDRLIFAFAGVGAAYYSETFRSIVFRWPSDESDIVETIDTYARVLDNNEQYSLGPTCIYGGANFTANSDEYTFALVYGPGGVAETAKYFRSISEGSLPAPTLVSPVSTVVTKNRVEFQVQSIADQLYENVRARLQFQVATDAVFTTELQTITESTDWRVYESVDGSSTQIKYISYTLTSLESLHTGDWYWRARMIDDLGGASDYSSGTFTISHPPSALVRSPANAATIRYASGDVTVAWDFSDTEPADTQTAYQIVLVRTDTSATVTDTGKVVDSTQSATLTISSALRDIPLSVSVKLWDSYDDPGAFSTPIIFTVSDPPVVTITSPTEGQTITTGLPTISWTFVANARTQYAYRVLVFDSDADPDEAVGDTGWLVGTATSYTFTNQILLNTTNYYARVYVRDSVGLESYSEANLLGNPTFESTASGWTATSCTLTRSSTFAHGGTYSGRMVPSAACDIQSISYPATIGHEYEASAWVYSVAGWSDVTVTLDFRDSVDASIATEVTTLSLPAGQWTELVATDIAPALTAYVRVKVAMTNSPTASDILYVDDLSLNHTRVDFDTDWVPPDDGDISVVGDSFKVTISWTDANQDMDFIGWRVYRRYNQYSSEDLDVDDTAGTWVMIYETTDVESAYEYRDYFAPLNREIDYVVVQFVDRFGSSLESEITSFETITITGDRYYLVPAVPIGSIASFEASSITADEFTREVEQQVLHVLGRGRQVQQGDDLGYMGNLTFHFRNPATARSDREFIELLARSESGNIYIRSPYGDVLYVVLGSPTFRRMAGVGPSDLGDLTVSYTEVFQEVTLTRTV